nr:TIGR04423 family type III CRISPR-associated protein [uncultured Campylobacter sp.]
MKKNRDEILKYVNENLKGYEGYIQLIGEKIDEKHLFLAGERTPSLGEDELIYEAHFFDEKSKKSVSIRQINDAWFVDETELGGANLYPKKNPDIKEFHSKFKPEFSAKFKEVKIKMAQIWQDEKDEFCEVPQDNGTLEGLPVLKLQKIVFVGFAKNEKDKK